MTPTVQMVVRLAMQESVLMGLKSANQRQPGSMLPCRG
jgi:hypothetical protein